MSANNSHQTEDAEKRQKADALKEEGNECVKASKFNEAIEKYNEAIELIRDPVYFCNRAAAYCRIQQYDLAIQDCQSALELDKKFAKAYGRMGLAYYQQGRLDASLEAHETALALDPFYMLDDDYKNQMDLIQEKLSEAKAYCATLFGGNGGIADFSDCMNNEHVMASAKEMMKDPNIQNLMESMMESFMGGSPSGGGIRELLAAGQNMVKHMQQANPLLAEQLQLHEQFSDSSAEDSATSTTDDSGASSEDLF